MSRSSRNLWLKTHLYVGILAGIPLLLVGLTGGILAVAPEIHEWNEPEVYEVEAGGEQLPITEIIHRIREAYPEAEIFHTTVFKDPDRAWIVYTPNGRLIADPYTGQVMKAVHNGGLLAWAERVHRNLGAGKIGNYVVGISSLVVILLVLSGLYIWWPMRKGTIDRFIRRGTALGWHNVAGLLFAPLVVIMAFTGITFTFRSMVMSLVYNVTVSPDLPPRPTSEVIEEDSQSVSLAEAVHIVQEQFPRARVTGFGEAGGEKGVHRVHLGYAGEWNQFGWDRVYVDQYSGAILQRLDTYEHSWGSVYQHGGWTLHSGVLFGLPGRILWGIGSMILPLLFITGVLRWWKKRRKKKQRTRH